MIRSSCSRRPAATPRTAARLVVIALVKACVTQFGELPQLARILGAGIAVGEVLAEIELERLSEPRRLRHRLRVLREARGHRRRGGEHVS